MVHQQECLIADTTGLTSAQLEGAKEWADMYDRSYPQVGVLAASDLKANPNVLMCVDLTCCCCGGGGGGKRRLS